MLCIARSIVKDKDIRPATVAQELYAWFTGYPMGIGRNTYSVLSFPQYLLQPEEASKTVWEMSNCESAANGAVMRTSIIGLWNRDIEKKAKDICKLTHYDPRCIGSCVIVSVLINKLVHDEILSKEEIIQIGDRYDARIREYIELSVSPDIADLKLDYRNSMGYTLKTLSAALWVYFNCNSFEEGLKAVVHEGGDADTNAAVACSILGAKFGFDNIPKRYVDELHGKDELFTITEQLNEILAEDHEM
jgi:ADP-ribosylglycohydrolase